MGQRKEQVVWSSGLPLDSWCAPGTSDYLKTGRVTASPTWLLLGVCGHKQHLLSPRSLWSSRGLLCGSAWSTRKPRSCLALLSSITLNPEPHPCTWPQHSPLYSRCIPHSLGTQGCANSWGRGLGRWRQALVEATEKKSLSLLLRIELVPLYTSFWSGKTTSLGVQRSVFRTSVARN